MSFYTAAVGQFRCPDSDADSISYCTWFDMYARWHNHDKRRCVITLLLWPVGV